MPTPGQPVLHRGPGEPVGPDDLAPLFPMELILQEVSEDPEVPIPDEILDIYSLWRPTPLYRARRLEEAIGTRSRIFYKYEGVSPPGSHKPNTAVAQAYYNAKEGRTRLATETGAGQWGSALAFACKLLELECKVYMVKISYEQKPFRRSLIQAWGAEIVASPSEETQSGRAIREQDPESPGSLGIAISEAVEDAAGRDDTAYSLGSVLNHVLLHQTVIGQEALAQMELAGAFPDVVIGCVGGGSNFAGFAFAVLFAGSEGILPAPEAAHAIHGTVQTAKAADGAGEERTILFNLSGHGHFDMSAYDNYFAGKLEDVALDEAEMQRALRAIEGLPTPA